MLSAFNWCAWLNQKPFHQEAMEDWNQENRLYGEKLVRSFQDGYDTVCPGSSDPT